MLTRWLVVIVKAPQMGRTKTRLARDLGAVTAAHFSRFNLVDLVRRLGRDPRWRLVVSVSPDIAAPAVEYALGVPAIPQGKGDLGARMQRIMDGLPPGPALIIGADIPGIRGADIADAFVRLGAHDAVLGPSPDGGFWLVGLKRRPHLLKPFAPVRWSGPHALSDVMRNLNGCGIATVRSRADIDTAEDFHKWRAGNLEAVHER